MILVDCLIRRPLPTIFTFALAVRLINIALLPDNDAFFAEPDTSVYWTLGRALADPITLSSTIMAMTERLPLYPLLVGTVQRMFGDAPRMVVLIQAMIDAGTCTAIAALGMRFSPQVGWWSGLLAALSVNLIVYSSQVLPDTLGLFWLTLMLLAGAHFLARPAMASIVLAGAAGGLAAVTRPALALLVVTTAPVAAIAAYRHRRRIAPALGMTLIYAAVAALPVAPVLVRNALYYGDPSLTSLTGDHLLRQMVPLTRERADGIPYQTTASQMELRVERRLAEHGMTGETNPFRVSALKAELAREELASLPRSTVAKAWTEGALVNLGAPALLADPRVRAWAGSGAEAPPRRGAWDKLRSYLFSHHGLYEVLLLTSLAATLAFDLLAAVGLVMLARASPWAALFATGIVTYFLMLNGPVATPKYRLPIEPVLIVLAALPLAALKRRRPADAPAMAGSPAAT